MLSNGDIAGLYKDRKGRMLSFEEILHYQKIIVAVRETDRKMRVICGTGIE